MPLYRFDLPALFARLGGPNQVAYILGKMGMPLAARTPYKWLQRGSIDGVYLANLLAHEALHADHIDLNEFIVPDETSRARRPRQSLAGLGPSVRKTPQRGAEY